MLERDNRIGIISKLYSAIAKNCKSNFFIASKYLIKVTHEHKIPNSNASFDKNFKFSSLYGGTHTTCPAYRKKLCKFTTLMHLNTTHMNLL